MSDRSRDDLRRGQFSRFVSSAKPLAKKPDEGSLAEILSRPYVTGAPVVVSKQAIADLLSSAQLAPKGCTCYLWWVAEKCPLTKEQHA